jgi:hypothetical protein
MSDAGRMVAAVLRASGLDVRVARGDPRRPGTGEIVASNSRCPSWGTAVIDPATLARWWDRWAPVADHAAAAAVAAAIICWMGSEPGNPAGQTTGLRILPPPEDFPGDPEVTGNSVIGWRGQVWRYRDRPDGDPERARRDDTGDD